MMEDQAFDNKMNQKVIGTMREQILRMDGLVQQLLHLSKIEGGAQVDMNEVVDVPNLLEVLQRQALALGNEQYDIVFDIDEKLKVFGNEEQLRSAMTNLVYNAIRHTSPGTRIEVSWRNVSQGALFTVKDNGGGISAEHLPRLTERFYRVDRARSRQTGGNGLGLAIVKHALHHYNTHLDIESTLGKGSVFSFLLASQLIVSAKK